MEKFAKLFDTKYGQIMVKNDVSEDDYLPEVRIYFMPKGAGVCSIGFKFSNSDKGCAQADKLFENATDEWCVNTIKDAVPFPSMFG